MAANGQATARSRRTPCVGICSTTYGDLVCRGCKRFAHEIIAWNGYDDAQRDQVWERLNTIRDEVIAQRVQVVDEQDLHAVGVYAGFDNLEPAERVYRVLAWLVRKEWPLAKAGLRSASPQENSTQEDNPQEDNHQEDPIELMRSIDTEMYARAKAHYERNFKTPT